MPAAPAAYPPEIQQLVQDQVSRLSPEQQDSMRAMAGRIDPSKLAEARSHVENLGPEKLKELLQNHADTVTEGSMELLRTLAAAGDAGIEVVQRAEELKEMGTEYLKAKDYEAAAGLYEEALMALGDLSQPLQQPSVAKYLPTGMAALWIACQLNLAHAQLQIASPPRRRPQRKTQPSQQREIDVKLTHAAELAVVACDQVLACPQVTSHEGDPSNFSKALYRRGKAKLILGHLSEALTDLQRAQTAHSSGDKAIAKLIAEVKARQAADTVLGCRPAAPEVTSQIPCVYTNTHIYIVLNARE